ncbi:penicillin acylase family protein [Eudoraea chungangensis]|uniref:penicillin acylase family protein n=1 Tax=Eudoraea chungangensis TaxID=1481905 RepID=UPI0023EC3E1A|nr:penicillin acylase family protein [Eudoraea chungangensis]
MKLLKRIVVVVLLLVGLIIIGGYFFVQSMKPDYSGQKELAILDNPVEVYFDTYGIPHIYSKTEKDAIKSLGYLHAQERLWQMDLLRRAGAGRLSEVFGKDLLEVDMFLLSLGIDEATKKTLVALDQSKEFYEMTQDYLEGVNTYIQSGSTPIEYYLTGLEKTPFTVEDVYNSMGYMAFSFAMAHKTDPLLTEIAQTLGVEYLEDLAINASAANEWIKNFRKDTLPEPRADLSSFLPEGFNNIPVPQFIGSNSWVLSEDKTKNGKVILANDPHMGFSQPAVWYEAHISSPSYEKYGYYIAGIPFPLMGHNRQMALGLTMFENDDVDFFYEEINPEEPSQYKALDGWKTLETTTKLIQIKDTAAATFTYQKTERGIIMPSFGAKVEVSSPVSMSWIYTLEKNDALEGLYKLHHASGLEEVELALRKIHAPGLNIMYGDKDGNIAWWATAKLYQLPDSTHTKFIRKGASANAEPVRFLDFSENPAAVNPPWGYVYSANNQPDSIAGMLYPGYYLPENRGKRIVELLEEKQTWDAEEVQDMMLDNTSTVNRSIANQLIDIIYNKDLNKTERTLIEELKTWDGNFPLDAVEPGIYHRWIYNILKFAFKDELGEDLFKDFLATHFHKRLIAPLIEKDNSVWWDDVETKNIAETKEEIVWKAYKEAIDFLEQEFGKDHSKWTWNRMHIVEHPHPIGKIQALRSFFNVGPYEIEGAREVINNMYFDYTEEDIYKVKTGPSTRIVVDFSDIENSKSIIPTGQSGNPFSRHYRDQAVLYHHNKFRKMLLNKEEILNSSTKLLLLQD